MEVGSYYLYMASFSYNVLNFLWLGNIPVCVCVCVYIYTHTHQNLSIHSSIDEHLDSLYTLSIMNNASINFSVLISVWK